MADTEKDCFFVFSEIEVNISQITGCFKVPLFSLDMLSSGLINPNMEKYRNRGDHI